MMNKKKKFLSSRDLERNRAILRRFCTILRRSQAILRRSRMVSRPPRPDLSPHFLFQCISYGRRLRLRQFRTDLVT